ncbi:MAG: IS1182 family transposase [Steroidobacteraceae bacterium]
MSLPAPREPRIPAETVRVARAAFPRGNPYMAMRDALGPIYTDPQFVALFPKDGQPAESPGQLALVTVMQFAEGLSDRQAADAVRGRIDWKYALALELTDPGFDASVLSEFRSRLVAGQAELVLFETLLAHLRAKGLVKPHGRQRTDSTHVLAAIHVLNRLECVGETLRHALNTLATVAPDWLRAGVPPAWFDRYGQRLEDYRLPASKADRYALAEQIGADGRRLLEQVYAADAPAWVRAVPAVQVVRRVWLQQFYAAPPAEPVRWRTADDLPPGPLLISSPYDPDARYSKKRATEWVGYKAHLTESCDDDAPHLITNVETTLATDADSTMTATIQAHLAARDLVPREHVVDTSYVTSAHLITSQEMGTDLLGPILADQSWQTRACGGFGVASFTIDWEGQQAICPRGKASAVWDPKQDSDGHDVISIRFAHADCVACPARPHCVHSPRPRTLTIRPRAQYAALQTARQRQTTDEFKARYAIRAGVEGTISQGVRRCDLRRSRYLGLPKTRLHHLLIATALNFVRTAAWFADIPLARTRRSAFAALAAAA